MTPPLEEFTARVKAALADGPLTMRQLGPRVGVLSMSLLGTRMQKLAKRGDVAVQLIDDPALGSDRLMRTRRKVRQFSLPQKEADR
jgi:hypothetical protein